jgi:ribosomal protein S18 acetylase RimI-like enzyme
MGNEVSREGNQAPGMTSSSVTLRDATSEDIPAATQLLSQLGYLLEESEVRKRFGQVNSAAGHRIVVAEMKEKIVGLLHIYRRPALEKPCEAVVQSLVVDAKFRGKGIGAALMREAETWATSQNLESTVLYTRIDREQSRAFYERIGYRLKATSHLMGRG